MYRRDHDEALRRFTALLEIEPDDPTLHRRLGDVYFRVARYDDAAREYAAALAESPEDSGARSGWWAARLQQGGFSDETDQAL